MVVRKMKMNHHFVYALVTIFLVSSSLTTVLSLHRVGTESNHHSPVNQTLKSGRYLLKWKRVRATLRKVNKPAVKTIQSPDGDLIDCVLTHLQPAFDHPELKGKRPLDPPQRPKGIYSTEPVSETFQQWASSGESCPEGTVPIRRTTEKDIMRASSIKTFGRKLARNLGRDAHEHAIVYVYGDQYFGAKATLNVWAPYVADREEFSLSQMWVVFDHSGYDDNTIEAGWQVFPKLYGDNQPRLFTFWTAEGYQNGCYNLLCSGFVQTSNKIAVGAALSPRSSYSKTQFEIGLVVWKDPEHGNWWLECGPGQVIGYWPAYLFTNLRDHANMVQFGGEVVNSEALGVHTTTQMGSGHFAEEGYGKASYLKNLQVVGSKNNLLPISNPRFLTAKPNCYNIKQGKSNGRENIFFFGGPGRNVNCP